MFLPESITPALIATGLLCLLLPWVSRESAWARATCAVFSLLLTWNYLLWRLTQTIPSSDSFWDCSLGIGFFAAELLTAIGGSITWVLLSRSCSRSATVEANTPWLAQTQPFVDVLICTYNEDRAILERTIIGATSMKYPNFRVWVLDDGRRDWLVDLCAQKNCHYITRPDNSHAKASLAARI
jgi:cellulose synthase (UDP-forming)